MLYIIYLSRVARVEEECGAFKTDPVTLPASFSRQLHLMFLPEEPLLDAEEARLPHGSRAVKRRPRATLLGFVGRGVDTLRVVILRHRCGERHPVVI